MRGNSSMLRSLLAVGLVLLIDGCSGATSVRPSIKKVARDVSSDPKSLLEAVRILLSEVSDLKDQNLSLRRDVDQAESEISILKQQNEALNQNLTSILQQQQSHESRRALHHQPQPKVPPKRSHSRSTKLRGTPDEVLEAVVDTAIRERVEALEDKLACVSDSSNMYDLYFEGCNVHVRDGSGYTEGTSRGTEQTGRGNLLIGYNEKADPDDAPEVCSNSAATDYAGCRKTGGVWGQGLQTGIHNLIVGAGHSYTRHSGIVAGTHNGITGIGSVVIGGRSNVASGEYSTVSGGVENTSSGKTSVVLGGYDNTASGDDSLVGGGSYNTAGGSVSAVVGGENNQANGDMSFISGGNLNQVLGEYSCSTSSFGTVATGKETVISGSRGVIAALDTTIISGERFGMPIDNTKGLQPYNIDLPST